MAYLPCEFAGVPSELFLSEEADEVFVSLGVLLQELVPTYHRDVVL